MLSRGDGTFQLSMNRRRTDRAPANDLLLLQATDPQRKLNIGFGSAPEFRKTFRGLVCKGVDCLSSIVPHTVGGTMLELSAQPRQRKTKVMAHHVDRQSQCLGGFLGSHASEVAHLDKLSEHLVLACERVKCGVELDEFDLLVHVLIGCFDAGDLLRGISAASLPGSTRTCMIDQDLSHDPRRDSDEMDSVSVLMPALAGELQVEFVNQGCRLQCMIGSLSVQPSRRDSVEFVVELAYQIIQHGRALVLH